MIKVFIAGQPGYFSYEVGEQKEQALEHMSSIIRDGYRRVDERQQLVHFMPRIIDKVIIAGPDITSDYPDTSIIT